MGEQDKDPMVSLINAVLSWNARENDLLGLSTETDQVLDQDPGQPPDYQETLDTIDATLAEVYPLKFGKAVTRHAVIFQDGTEGQDELPSAS